MVNAGNKSNDIDPPPVNSQPIQTASFQKPAFEIFSLSGLISDIPKLLFGLVFVLYAVGFLIWRSYLGAYGVSTSEFLQTEYLSAALCYLVLLVALAVPPAVIIEVIVFGDKKQNKQTFFVGLASLWVYLMQQLAAAYFPDGHNVFRVIFFIIYVTVGLLHCLIIMQLRNKLRKSYAIFNFFASPHWYPIYMIVFSLLSLYSNSVVNKNYFITTLLFCCLGYSISTKSISIFWKDNHPSVKLLIIVFVCLALVNNIREFASTQFGLIPKAVGGGKPEIATIKLIQPDTNLCFFLTGTNMTSTNGIIGPVAVLLSTDKQTIFIDVSAIGTTNRICAKEIRAELIQAKICRQ